MKILALDYSSNRRSVALVADGRILVERADDGAASTSSQAMIAAALEEAGWSAREVQAVAIGVGPGSYTGIRLAIAVAQGWVLTNEIPIFAISSFAAMAWELLRTGRGGPVRLAAYAQRGEFVTTCAQAGRADPQWVLSTREEVIGWIQSGATVISPDDPGVLPGAIQMFPQAGWIGSLVTAEMAPTAPEELAPVYLRKAEFIKAPTPRIAE